MVRGGPSKAQILESEVEFWESIAEHDQYHLSVNVPTLKDLSDSFAYSSDRSFLERIGPANGLTILDIGCGFGALSLYLANEGADVVGLDIVNGMTTLCRKRSSATGVEAQFVTADAEQLPFKDCSFDRVIGMRTIHHFPNIKHFFEETHRVLAPSGRAVFVEPQKNNPIVEVNRKLLQPEKRTPYEHPLVREDIDSARAVFPEADVETFYLISPVAFIFKRLVRSDSLANAAKNALQAAETRLTSSKRFQDYCWQVVLMLPKREETTTD